MKYKILTVMLLILVTAVVSSGQTSYKGITPGKSRKVEVDRVLGQPVKQLSETLVEYRPQPLAGRIYVQYRSASGVVERIEFICHLPDSNCNDFMRSLNIQLPESAEQTSPFDDKGRYLAFAPPPYYIVETGDRAVNEENNGWMPVRVAFYSRELFEAELEKAKKANEAIAAAAVETPKEKPSEPVLGSVADSTRQEKSSTTAPIAEPVISVSGRWSGSWRNDKGESGNSSVNITELAHGEIKGDEDGWVIEDGHRTGSLLMWLFRKKNNGCRDYVVRWEISPDGSTASGTYRVTDSCEKTAYSGQYLNYRR